MLALSGLPPISLMVQVSQTNLSKSLPEGTDLGNSQSGTVAFPQQISLFYAGKIAPGVGAFIQLTYGNDSGTIGIDNVDLRWAGQPRAGGGSEPDVRHRRQQQSDGAGSLEQHAGLRLSLCLQQCRGARRSPARRSTGRSARTSRA